MTFQGAGWLHAMFFYEDGFAISSMLIVEGRGVLAVPSVCCPGEAAPAPANGRESTQHRRKDDVTLHVCFSLVPSQRF